MHITKKAKLLLKRRLPINIYQSNVEPYFNYCSTVWDSIDQTQCDKLQKLQNRAVRIITSASSTAHTSDVFSDLGWSLLTDKRRCQKAIMMHKITHAHAPSCFGDMFDKEFGLVVYNLRSSNKNIQIPKVRIECYKKSFAISGSRIWNS